MPDHKLAKLNTAASDNGVEWGEYVERCDNGRWTPLIYTAESDRAVAEDWVRLSADSDQIRNSQLVRRVVGDWKPAS